MDSLCFHYLQFALPFTFAEKKIIKREHLKIPSNFGTTPENPFQFRMRTRSAAQKQQRRKTARLKAETRLASETKVRLKVDDAAACRKKIRRLAVLQEMKTLAADDDMKAGLRLKTWWRLIKDECLAD